MTLVLAALGSLVFGSGAKAASLAENEANCEATDPTRSIAGCSALLAMGSLLAATDRAQILVNRAEAYLARHDFEHARADAEAAGALDRRSGRAASLLGQALVGLDRPAEAILAFTEAIKLDPTDADDLMRRGRARAENADRTGARADFDQAVQLRFSKPQPYLERGRFLLKIGDLVAARRDFETSVTLGPNLAAAYFWRGRSRARADDLDGARADFDAAIFKDGKFAAALVERGSLRERAGDTVGAMEDYARAAQGDPADPDVAVARDKLGLRSPVPLPVAAGSYSPATPGEIQAALGPSLTKPPAGAVGTVALLSNGAVGTVPVLSNGADESTIPLLNNPGRRFALVAGNNAYLGADLVKAENDARAVGQSLGAIGYKVTLELNRTRVAFDADFEAFLSQLAEGDSVFFFFAGHGEANRGSNFILPVDAIAPPGTDGSAVSPDADKIFLAKAISTDDLMQRLHQRKIGVLIFVIDACRVQNAALGRAVELGRGLGRPDHDPPHGTLVLMSAGFGQQALDRLASDDPDPNSVFTRILLPLLGQHGLTHTQIAKALQIKVSSVARSVGWAQNPAIMDEINGELILNP